LSDQQLYDLGGNLNPVLAGVLPQPFGRIQFRRVGRQLVHFQPMPVGLEPSPDLGVLVVGGVVLNQNRSLAAVSLFGQFLITNVIPRPLGAGEAMARAGVRSLGSAVETQLLECIDPTEDTAMAARILGRRNQFGRVLESQIPGRDTEMALRRLAGIRYEAARSLLIRYSLSAFNRELESPPEEVPALYQRDQERLLFTPRDGVVSWPAIARELAVALFPEDDPGRIAASLKEVLAAESDAEAAAILDELGFARLDTSDHDAPTAELTSGNPCGPSSEHTVGSFVSLDPRTEMQGCCKTSD
jgi:hypothetical protein